MSSTNRPRKDFPLTIHLVAIGGTGMAPLACLLGAQGHRVGGSDKPLYPPMSTLLESAGIVPRVGYDAAHLEPPPDLVVIGNAVRSDNPEAVAAEERGIERISMPQALWRFFLAERRRLVVAGTHGKTTTTSMAAWVWTDCGRQPSYLVGGVPANLERSFDLGAGEHFIIEGDEYNASYFDRGPKFLHYRPDILVLTSAEYDHADLYPTPEALLAAYRELVAGMPADGVVVACGDHDEVREIAAAAPCRVVFYGLQAAGNDVFPADESLREGPEGSRFAVDDPTAGRIEIALPMPGRHNASNALGVWAAARAEGLAAADVAAALGRFRGVARRLEELGTAAGVTVVDDFAHHPTAVAASLDGLAARYPGRHLVALFEPRTLSAGRQLFEDGYRGAFGAASRVIFADTYYAERLADAERLDFAALARELTAGGTPAEVAGGPDAVLARARELLEPGDVAVTMSSGSFEGLPRRLLAALEAPGD